MKGPSKEYRWWELPTKHLDKQPIHSKGQAESSQGLHVLRHLAGVWYNLACQGARNNMATSYKSDLVKIYHSLGRKKRLGTVILFVTSVCNAKCRTCFYWEELNQRGDLTWDEIRKLSSSMPPVQQTAPSS